MLRVKEKKIMFTRIGDVVKYEEKPMRMMFMGMCRNCSKAAVANVEFGVHESVACNEGRLGCAVLHTATVDYSWDLCEGHATKIEEQYLRWYNMMKQERIREHDVKGQFVAVKNGLGEVVEE